METKIYLPASLSPFSSRTYHCHNHYLVQRSLKLVVLQLYEQLVVLQLYEQRQAIQTIKLNNILKG